MSKLNVIIVDDEPLALDVLETYIEKVPDLVLVKRCNNAFEANEAINNHRIDLIFLDIQMPQLTGIDFLKTLSHPPMVIFTTAYSNYALQSYELDAVDYLLKPISFERFMKAVNRAIEEQKLTVQAHQSHPEDTDEKDYIFIKADKKLVRVRFADIIYIEGLKDYVIIRLDQSRVITLQTMKSLEDKLPTPMFKRIHRSYIVNVNKIEAIVGNMVEVTEKGQTKHLPIGKNYRDELLQMINDNKL
ncbi:MAG TPA: LytTR family DNA-binding domain-containing protein [Saprospiraceae bacterium]|nr:response regulator transcription factor [Saprospiraceae bacterium]MCB9269463.1 response regulator transcription factor [Lewinellaceae bacterium]HPG06915.1 LytTR family DNA-binding domain-containing protein [Saprospiraceae bacterium]HPR01456.1 LytTR family DNA-binding domain-containing protein [Saprospiraceae bacterium]HRV85153.1 LytTR family DNA-binding domain-containing protein [Saprospiraceae bacterium]